MGGIRSLRIHALPGGWSPQSLDCGPSQTQPSNQSWAKAWLVVRWSGLLGSNCEGPVWHCMGLLIESLRALSEPPVVTWAVNPDASRCCIRKVASRPGLRRPWLDEMSYGRLKLSWEPWGIRHPPISRTGPSHPHQAACCGWKFGPEAKYRPRLPSMGTTSWRSVAGCRANLTAGGCMWPFPWVAVRGRRKSRMFKERASNITTYIVTSNILSYLSYTEDQGLTL